MEPHETDRAAMEALAAPIPAEFVHQRPIPGGGNRPFIKAPTVAWRLDEVLGPQNWDLALEVYANCIRARLKITLPSGRIVTRDGIGGYPEPRDGANGMSFEDIPKGAESDAIKRAGMRFGIGSSLDQPEPARRSSWGNTAHRPEPTRDGPPAAEDVRQIPELRRMSGGALYAWAKEYGLVKTVNDIGQQLNMSGRMVDWSEEDVTDVYRRLCQRAVPEPTR